ncbi:MAG: hypothetical protein MHM6MM_005538 [Cercozoa sp. M6MM]
MEAPLQGVRPSVDDRKVEGEEREETKQEPNEEPSESLWARFMRWWRHEKSLLWQLSKKNLSLGVAYTALVPWMSAYWMSSSRSFRAMGRSLLTRALSTAAAPSAALAWSTATSGTKPFFQALLAGTGMLVGTYMLSAAANALNQLIECEHDAQMRRTRERLLVPRDNGERPLSRTGALARAAAYGVIGVASEALVHVAFPNMYALWPLLLGVVNVGTYAALYTWMKRHTRWNTEIGSITGAIPTSIGLAAALADPSVRGVRVPGVVGGTTAPQSCWCLAPWFLWLYAWQFSHFANIDWKRRHEYEHAGFHMHSLKSSSAVARRAFFGSLAMLGIDVAMFVADMRWAPEWLRMLACAPWAFWVAPIINSGIVTYRSYKFWQKTDAERRRQPQIFSFATQGCSILPFPPAFWEFMPKKQASDGADMSPDAAV